MYETKSRIEQVLVLFLLPELYSTGQGRAGNAQWEELEPNRIQFSKNIYSQTIMKLATRVRHSAGWQNT